jgi:uncharacterized membrane protein
MIEVKLYSRADCPLCDEAQKELEALKERYPHRLVVVDVDSTTELHKKYGLEVPVVEVGPYTLKAPFTSQELMIMLGAAIDRERHIQMVENSPALEDVRQRGVWTTADSFTLWLSKHYLAMFNFLVFIYVGLPFLAPVLMKVGAEKPANLIYRGYSLVCHQLAFRSFFLYGPQFYYPRLAAGVPDVQTYAQVTGLSEASDGQAIYTAERYTGNAAIGYKVALCQRDVAIYAGILVFGLLFALIGRRLPPLPWLAWILIGLVPIGLDGFSQMFSQPPLSILPFRESTPLLRVVTGLAFGFMTAWLGFVMVEESMRESQKIMEYKWKRLFKA